MATYHNEKTLSEIALVNCFNKITANGIRTAEQLRQTEYYQEAIEAIYNFVRDAALKTKKSKDMLKASGLEADDVAGSFIIACMEKDSKINGLLNCRGEYSAYLCRCLANYIIDLSRHGTRKTKDGDAEREKIVAAADDQTLELLLSAEMEADSVGVGCEMIEFILGNVELSPVEKVMALSLDNKWHEVAAAYRSVHGVEKFVHMLTYETKVLFGTELFSGAEEHAAICTLKRAADPEKTLLLARYRARKKLVKEFGSQEELCRRLKKS